MTCITWRHVAAMLAVSCALDVSAASAAPIFTQGGDASFRNITATGGAIQGVDVSSALVEMNGSSSTLAAVAMQAANAVPLASAGQPNGWLKLDGNGLVPTASLPSSVTSPVDLTARSTASAAAAAASAALPASLLDAPNGVAPLDGNGLVPLAALPASVTSPTDMTARAAAAAAQTTANAAQTVAAAAMPSNLGNKPSGFAQLDTKALVPVALLPASGIASGSCAKASFDAKGRAVSCGALLGSDIPVDGTSIGLNASNSLSVIGGSVDSTARSEASSAQAVANAAIPSSTLGHASGPAQLDGNGLVPPASLDLINQPSGPVLQDASGNITAQSIADAGASAVKQALGAAIYGNTVNGAAYGMKCDERVLTGGSATTGTDEITFPTSVYTFSAADVGKWFDGTYQFGTNVPQQITAVDTTHNGIILGSWGSTFASSVTSVEGSGSGAFFTDDTTAFGNTIARYQSLVTVGGKAGAMISLPYGTCMMSGEEDVAATQGLRISGAGIAATTLMWWKPTNGLIITGSPNAAVTLDDFQIARLPNTNGASGQFAGTALEVYDAGNGAGVLAETNLNIQGATNAGSTDGWQVGDFLYNQVNPALVNVSVHNAPYTGSVAGLLPSEGNPIATPSALAAGVADDILVEGGGSQNGAAIDGTFVGVTTEDGLVGLDIAGFVQGLYVSNSRFVYSAYGVRADNLTAGELLIFTGNHVNASVADLYLNGMDDSQIGGNFFFRAGSAGNPWSALWYRNGDDTEIFGNGMNGAGLQEGATTETTAVPTSPGSGADPLLVSSTSGFLGGNAIYDITNPGIVPTGTTVTVTSGGNKVYTNQNLTGAVSANDKIVSALAFATVATTAAAGATSITLSTSTGFLDGGYIVDFTNPAATTFVQPTGITSISGNAITLASGLPSQLTAGDLIGVYMPEFGIFLSNDSTGGFGGFPDTVSANSASSIGGCYYGNNRYMTSLSVSGNAGIGGPQFQCDYTANGGQWGSNGYLGNIYNGQPALLDDGSRNLLAETTMTVGSYANAGKLTVQDFTSAGPIINQTVTDSSTGLTCMNYNANFNHNTCSGAFGAYGGSGGGTLTLATGNNSTFAIFKAGTATVYGELSCSTTGYELSWRVEGHYTTNGTTDTPSGFSAVAEADGDTQYGLGGTTPRLSGATAITPQLSTAGVGLQVVVGSGTGNNWSCTSELHELLVN